MGCPTINIMAITGSVGIIPGRKMRWGRESVESAGTTGKFPSFPY